MAQSKKIRSFQNRIAKGFFLIVALNAVFGLTMVAASYFACEFTPNMLREDYNSISAVLGMQAAWRIIRHPEDQPHPNAKLDEFATQFEAALQKEDRSVTVPGEAEIATKIHEIWSRCKLDLNHISNSDFTLMKDLLDDLVVVNEEAMYATSALSKAFEKKIIFVGLIYLAFSTLISFVGSKIIAHRLSSPLRKIARTLSQNPIPGEGALDLPPTTTSEINTLSQALGGLWEHLKRLKKIDVEELSNQKQRLAEILACVDDAIIVVDNNGTVIHSNSGMTNLLQVSVDKTIGQQWQALGKARSDFARLTEMISSPISGTQSLELRSSDGQTKVYEVRSRQVFDGKRNVGTVLLLNDVTERKHRDRLKREFVGVLSHELKTPLQSLSTAAELLQKLKNDLPENKRFLIDIVNDDAARIRAVANDFLKVSLGELHSLRLKLEPTSLQRSVEQWLRPFQVIAEEKQIQFTFEANPRHQAVVLLDKTKFPWAISNLVSNALRVTPQNGRVVVSMTETESEIALSFSDSGPGVPAALEKQVFEPYFQVPNEKSGNAGLLGLGLSITKEVVNAHGGHVSYRKNSPVGAVFEIRLPKSDQEFGATI